MFCDVCVKVSGHEHDSEKLSFWTEMCEPLEDIRKISVGLLGILCNGRVWACPYKALLHIHKCTHTLSLSHSLPLVAEYLLFASMGVKREALCTHHQAFSVCFRNNAGWYFQGDPSHDYTVVTAAMCSVSCPAVWSLLHIVDNSHTVFLIFC